MRVGISAAVVVLLLLPTTVFCLGLPSDEPETMPSSTVFLSLLAVALLQGVQATPLSTHPYDTRARSSFAVAPLYTEEHPHGTVNNSYIVMLRHDIAPELMDNHMNFLQLAHSENPLVGDNDLSDGLRHVYNGQVKGYAGRFSENTIERIRQMPEVDYVEKDQIVRTTESTTQIGAPWVSHFTFIWSYLKRHLITCACMIGSRPYFSSPEARLLDFHQVPFR